MDIIDHIFAWEALDSRGTPTVACAVRLESGVEGEALVPSGASTGSHEAHERRDGGERYSGKGVADAVAAVRTEIGSVLAGHNVHDQEGIDAALRALDGTPNLSRLGGNAVLAASVACALAAARSRGVPLWQALCPDVPPLLPLPMVNVISGGAHAGTLLDVQDFLVVPVGAGTFAEAIEWASRVRGATASVLRERGYDVSLVADEGGLAAPLSSNRAALDVLLEGIERSGLEPGAEAAIAVDVAATQLLVGDTYLLASENRGLRAEELVEEIVAWVDDYPIVSIEDAVGEDDHSGWRHMTDRLGDRIQVLGDDLFVTSPDRVGAGIREGIANAVLVKPNQIGTLSEARHVVQIATSAGYATVLSARSGETEDCWLADLAVGWRTGQIKVGSTTRSDRTGKWNRLLRIEAERDDAEFAGRSAIFGQRLKDVGAGRNSSSPRSVGPQY
jgi:enolase